MNPVIDDFIHKPYGANYKVTKKQRIKIFKKIQRIVNEIPSATSIETHLTLVKFLLDLPKKKLGAVVECGCYYGASSATLSLICKIIGRKLIIYDSFEGLPNEKKNKKRIYPHLNVYGYYQKGMYKCSQEIVESNISKYGNMSVCNLRPGFFDKSLKFHKERIEFSFLDVDLETSTKSCILSLWPHILNGSYIFTDDACDIEIVKIWFDDNWWNKNLKISSPGFIGSGCGLPISKKYSSLGYTIKNIDTNNLDKVKWLKYN